MNAAANVLVVRSSTALSNGYRGVVAPTTQRSSSRGSGTASGSGGGGATLAVAGAACTLCNSLRTTAACSASTALNLRHVHSSPTSSTTIMDTNSFVGVQSLASIGHGSRQQLLPPVGGGRGVPAVVAWNSTNSTAACNNKGLTRRTTSQTAALDPSSKIAAPTLQSQTGDIMGKTSVGISATAATSVSSSSHRSGGGRALLLEGNTSGGGWSSAELLTGAALLFAGAGAAASVGSIFLGPNVDGGLRGNKTNNVGGGGGMNGHGGSGGSNNNGSDGGGGSGPGADKYQHSFDSSVKEQDDKEDILGLEEAAAPRAYEVSIHIYHCFLTISLYF